MTGVGGEEPRFAGAMEAAARTEFVTLTFWESVEAIRGFAGDDVERAVYFAEDDRFLVEREVTVTHREVE